MYIMKTQELHHDVPQKTQEVHDAEGLAGHSRATATWRGGWRAGTVPAGEIDQEQYLQGR